MVGVASCAARVRVAPARAGAVHLVAACWRGLPCRWPAVGGTPTSTNRLQLQPLSTSWVFEWGEGVEPTFILWLGWGPQPGGSGSCGRCSSRRFRPWRRPSRPRAKPYPPPPPAVACGKPSSTLAAAACRQRTSSAPMWEPGESGACQAALLFAGDGGGGCPRWPRGCACLPWAPSRGRRRRRGWLEFSVASPSGGGRSTPVVWRQRWRCGERARWWGRAASRHRWLAVATAPDGRLYVGERSRGGRGGAAAAVRPPGREAPSGHGSAAAAASAAGREEYWEDGQLSSSGVGDG